MADIQEEPRPNLPQRELDKAYGLGKAARAQGKAESACPFVLPQMREEWLSGFREEGGQ
jgi:ribosome modulation factor